MDERSNLSKVQSAVFKRNDKKIFIYPNPTNGQITIANVTTDTTPTIHLFNTLGQKVLTTHETTVSISHLPKGIYTIEVQTVDDVVLKKVIFE